MSTTWRPGKNEKLFLHNTFQQLLLFTFSLILHLGGRAKAAFENLKKNYTKKRSNLEKSKTSGTSKEAVEKTENELKPFKFLTWLENFAIPRNTKSQFDQNDKEEYSQPVGELDDQTSQECESHERPDALVLDDEQTNERYLDEGRSPRVVKTYKNLSENVAASVV